MLINSLVHVTVLLSDLSIPFALQNRLYYSKYLNPKNHVTTALDGVLKELQYFDQKTYYDLGILSFKSHSKCYSAYLAINQLMITIRGFSDPYFHIACLS